jgi:hypothetical protein
MATGGDGGEAAVSRRTGDGGEAAVSRRTEEGGEAAVSRRSGDGGPAALEPRRRRTRIHLGELTSAVSALLLLVLMFATRWYGVAGVPDPSAARPAISTAVNGYNGLSVVRWVILLTIFAALGSVVLHASQRTHGTKTDTSLVVTALGSLTSLLLIYRVLIDLPAAGRVTDQKLGAFLGLLCALGIALGGWQSIQERKDSRSLAAKRASRRSAVASARRER